MSLYVLAEVAIMATDLAELIGSAIALNLLFGVPLIWGIVLTALDVLFLLAFWGKKRARYFELIIVVMVTTVAAAFIWQMVVSKPNVGQLFFGYLPSLGLLVQQKQLYAAIGILGATGSLIF